MSGRSGARPLVWLAGGVGLSAAAYAALVANAWLWYGRPAGPRPDEQDPLLDGLMPTYDIVERHRIAVNAPATTTFQAAREANLFESAIVRAIFRTREVVLVGTRDTHSRPSGIVQWAESLGWGVLAELPQREIVMGAVTQPWRANVAFRSLPPDRFRPFDTPGYVKIAWTLRADPAGDGRSVFFTETRAAATDAAARARFRRYWSFVSPGIWLIRRLTLQPVKRAAERRSNLRRIT